MHHATRAAIGLRPMLAAPALALGLLVAGVGDGKADGQSQCETMIDGRVAWNRDGATNWGWKSVKRLCRGSRDPYATIACFNAGIRRHNDWRRAIPDCAAAAQGRQSQQARRAPPPAPAPVRRKSIQEMSAHEFLYGRPAPQAEIRSGGYGLPVPSR